MAETKLKNQALDQSTFTGWYPANETWTYASATTITVPSGAASRYSIGDRIKLTQTTVKYFVVIGVADTVLTVTGGSDYTVANAAITNNYFSHEMSPVGYPASFNYTPTITPGSGSITTYTASGTFQIYNKFVSIYFYIDVTNNGTGGSTINVTLPVSLATNVSIPGISGNGKAVVGFTSGTTIYMRRYDNGYPIDNNTSFICSGSVPMA